MPRKSLAGALPVIKRFSSLTARPGVPRQKGSDTRRPSAAPLAETLALPERISTMTKTPRHSTITGRAARHGSTTAPRSADPQRPLTGRPPNGLASGFPSLQRKLKKRS